MNRAIGIRQGAGNKDFSVRHGVKTAWENEGGLWHKSPGLSWFGQRFADCRRVTLMRGLGMFGNRDQ